MRKLSRWMTALLLVAAAFVTLFYLLPGPTVQAKSNSQSKGQTIIYLFWGDGCPHCAAEKPFLEELTKTDPRIELRLYEVWHNEQNLERLNVMAASFGFEATGVPVTFVGQRHWVGYNDQIRDEIGDAVKTCLQSGCPDAALGMSGEPVQPGGGLSGGVIDVPLIGRVDLNAQSLTFSTLLIAFVDGFNPCSIWVLTMLLALTLHSGSRKKVLAIGLIFLTVTAAIYGLFIAGLFTVFRIVSFVGWIQVIVALMALFFGLVNIKDYFWYKEGLSFTIADSQKPGIFQKMRRVMDASQSFWGLAGATVVMSAGVSLVEFSCTAGFPVLWTNLLAAQNVSVLTFVLLLLLYLVIYQLDELGIFLVAVFSLKSSRLEEKHGRILKLVGGILMLTLAGVMIVNPTAMNNLASSLVIFGLAFAATLLVLLIHRIILPAFGIWVGTEARPERDKVYCTCSILSRHPLATSVISRCARWKRSNRSTLSSVKTPARPGSCSSILSSKSPSFPFTNTMKKRSCLKCSTCCARANRSRW